MKKTLSVLTVLVLIFALVGCKKQKAAETSAAKEQFKCDHCEETADGNGNKIELDGQVLTYCDDCYKIAFLYKDTNFKSAAEVFAEMKKSEKGEIMLFKNPIRFEEVHLLNREVCAWIQIEGMEVIDYPILQSATADSEDFYLDHDINGEQKKAGSIYIQRYNRNDFSDRNTVIYGHNMRNGTMFGQLKKFRDKTFFNEHRNIYIYTPDKIMQYEIISAFVYDDRHLLASFNFNYDDEKCQEFFDTCTNPRAITKQVLEGAELTTDDQIITLSTCTSNNTERYLVIGKLIATAKTVK